MCEVTFAIIIFSKHGACHYLTHKVLDLVNIFMQSLFSLSHQISAVLVTCVRVTIFETYVKNKSIQKHSRGRKRKKRNADPKLFPLEANGTRMFIRRYFLHRRHCMQTIAHGSIILGGQMIPTLQITYGR